MFRAAVAALLLAGPALCQHTVWVVATSAGPGVDFTSLQVAVDTAQQGDTILVRGGNYGHFILGDKSLSITADTGATVNVQSSFGSTRLLDLAANHFVTIAGLKFRSQTDTEPGLLIEDCAGSIWLQGCLMSGQNTAPSLLVDPPTEGLRVMSSDSVVLSDCTLFGGAGLGGARALRATDSELHLYGTSCTGGSGQCDGKFIPTCGGGGTAVVLDGGLFTAQSSTLTGGVPAPGNEVCIPFCLCNISPISGAALGLGDGSPQVFLYDSTLSVGPPHPPCGLANGSATQVVTGSIDASAGSPLVVSTSSPQRVGNAASLDFAGAPGDVVVALLAIFPLDVWLPKWHGPWLVGGNFQIFALGVVPGSGLLSLPFVVPPLPPGFDSVEFIAQAARTSAEGTLLANPARVILLAPGF